MKPFHCTCGARIFFDNTACLTCGRELGFIPEAALLWPLEAAGADGTYETPHGAYRKCENNVAHGVCNWLVRADDPETLCTACRLNHVIPDLSNEQNRALWADVEAAKRRLIYSLNALGLPIVAKRDDPEKGLAFDIKADENGERVLTGHSDGLITLNLDEADPAKREQMRVQMNERYRTLLGHFRHEIGHYYFDILIDDDDKRAQFRALFGDEREDYGEALKRHYASTPAPNWQEQYISVYASSHPWEDWAETFAHYLHLFDTLETARNFGVTYRATRTPSTKLSPVQKQISDWGDLTIALNALNRSMGMPDPYPFALSEVVRQKLELVGTWIRERSGKTENAPPPSVPLAKAG